MPRRETQRHTAKLLRTAPHYTKDDISQLDHFSFSLPARPVHDFYIAVITARQKLRLELLCCRLDVVVLDAAGTCGS